ncbi:anaphase-promoting complex, subunit 10-domain-containing protein [Scheffersomyces coipomensis]|uniref:anaphase-promoting complex, subunit 10-domain-containing protein n=1 Tax=Scheffersomyces coipomensis TaxID=1788519 RepID=UPI00315CB633
MNSSGHWDHSGVYGRTGDTADEYDVRNHPFNSSSVNALATSSHGDLDLYPSNQSYTERDSDFRTHASDFMSPDDIASNAMQPNTNIGGDDNAYESVPSSGQLSIEQAQRVYYVKGLEELESFQLVDLSPLANWKLSSYKQGFGLAQLRDDSPDSYWQSDGSNGNNNNNAILNNQLCNPHSITIQFSKKVSLERISIFTNYSLDESYTPSQIRIMAGSSEGWDLGEVCTVNFSKPIGWSHIIFNGIRGDGVLKCFMVKIIILANHQDGKDSHIRAVRCFGKKKLNSINLPPIFSERKHGDSTSYDAIAINSDILKDLSLASGLSNSSGFSINQRNQFTQSSINTRREFSYIEEGEGDKDDDQVEEGTIENETDKECSRVLNNVADVIGFNSGFQSLDLQAVSSIR